MMKRTRVDEVQFGTRPGPGPGGVGGSGSGGATGVGVGVAVGTVTGSAAGGVGVNAAGVTIMPNVHSATLSGIGIGGQIAHHRILTPQHGGAQTIAYLPSTTPTATNLKTTSSIVESAGAGTQISAGASGVVVSTGSAGTQTLQYGGTSYSVASIQAGGGGTLKASTADGNTVQIHVTGGGAAVSAQTVSSSSQTATIRQRTISGTQTVNTSAVGVGVGGNLIATAQPQAGTQSLVVGTAQTPPQAAAQPPNGPGTNSVGSTSPPSGGSGGGQPGNTTPRLKVEDALTYLDLVKLQYADQPQIYNNFLDIMKEFKSHCIDTPGVIERVSTLFKGHTELIYGFNMFLPPGYKIEIHSDALGCSVPVVSMPSPPGAPTSTGTVHMIAGSPLASAVPHGINIKTQSGASSTPGSGVAQIPTGGAVNLMTHGGASLTQTTIHALQTSAPNQVPSQSPSHVHVSNVPSPAQQQSISVSAQPHNVPQNYSRDRERATITASQQQGQVSTSATAGLVVGGPATPNALSELSPAAAAGAQHNLHHIQQAHQSILLGETTGQQNQPVEFNHAITYVNKIKNRFQTQPAIYKRFLEILHRYQKEQKMLKEGNMNQGKMVTEQEVYTEVAKLFEPEEDLLREFRQFLPDATNQSAAAAAQYMSAKTAVHNEHKRPTTATLSGGAHISMSPAPSGSPLHLSSGATLSQLDSSSAHAAAIGNLSAVNTSVSIKSYNNSAQQNHVMGASSGGLARNEVLYEKDYHGLPNSHGPGRGTVGGLPGSGPPPTSIRGGVGMLGGLFEKEHRNNHHAQKYMGPGGTNLTKKSPSYSGISSGIGSMAHMSDNSLDRNSPGINYVTPPLPAGVHQHHHLHNAGSRRPADDGGGGPGMGGLPGGPPSAKRPKPYVRDVSFSEASRKCTISDAAFFDKVRKSLRSPEVYENFLRCLTLFNQEIVSKTELLGLVSPFLMKSPDLLRWFTEFLGPPHSHIPGSGPGSVLEPIPLATTQRQSSSNSSQDRASSHQSADVDVDLSLCKRLGASYCALPQSMVPKKCSGRTPLCREVLNDKWVSFPTWASEDSTFVTSRKTQFEETIYRTEDERFELDLVIEVNSATIRVLENVQKKMSRMSPEELAKYHLDDYLGGTSQTIHQRAIHRIYGDKSAEIIQGMKKNPSVAVPIVLKRLKVKEEEWRDAQKTFNKQWREQNEKYYLKSLDHQAINFKPNDMKALRSKSLFNEIEALYDERHDQEQDEENLDAFGPHLILPYKDKTILDDAANLLIHHVKRQTGIQKQEKQKIKQIIRQFVPDLFYAPRQPLSDDERDDDDTKMDVDSPRNAKAGEGSSPTRSASSGSAGTSVSVSATIPALTPKKEVEAAETKPCGLPATALSSVAASGDDGVPSTSAAAVRTATAIAGTTGEEPGKDDLKQEAGIGGGGASSTPPSSAGATLASSSPPSQSSSSVEGGVSVGVGGATAPATSNPNSMDVDIKLEQVDYVNPPLLPPHAQGRPENESYSLFFANNNWYLFLRLHAILCDRLHVMYERARLLAIEEEKCRVNRRESTATALRLKPKPDVQVEDYYPTFLDMLKNVLDGNMDSNTFEDTMREMFGIYAYISFTLDKVVSNAVRQLQYCVTEKAALDCVDLFASEQRRSATGGFCRDAHKTYEREMSYQRKAEAKLNEENCFKVFIYKIDCRVTIELLDSEPDEAEKPALKAQKFSKYVERLANPTICGSGNSVNPASLPSQVSAAGSGGGGSGGGSNENMVESSDVKTEEEENNAELMTRGLCKARFLMRNKRKSKLHEEQVRQLFEQKRILANRAAATTATVTETTEGVGINATATVTNNNNNITWNKRPLERLGTPQVGLAQQYAFNDRDEFTTNASNGRCFVTSKNLKLLKYDAVRRAKKSHCQVTQTKYARFQAYVSKWLQQHVSDQQQQHCTDWLLGKTAEQINASGWGGSCKTKSLQQKDVAKTPYRTYNRYKVIQPGNNVTTTALNTVGGPVSSAGGAGAGAASVVTGTPSGPTPPVVSNSIGSGHESATPITNAPTTQQQQHHCNSAVAAAASVTSGNAETATLQQVRPMES